jgi:DNA polymerase III alpha subunit
VVVLEDLTDQLEIMIWSETYLKAQQHLAVGNVVAVTGRVDVRDDSAKISANEVKPLKKPAAREKPVVLTFEQGKTTESDLLAVREALHSSPGSRQVEFLFRGDAGHEVRMVPHQEFRVSWTEDVRERLGPWLSR